MGAIKVTPADKYFGFCIKERVNWTCEKCNKYFPEGGRQGLDTSHGFGRGNWEIRFDPLNAMALCYGCHTHYGGVQQLDDKTRDILYEKMQDRDLGREARRTKGKGEIAKHYREELKRMKELRADGETGRIEFVGYF